MPEKLPKGWQKTTLGEVCTHVPTIHPEDSPDIEFTYFDIGGIDNQNNRIVDTKTFVGREAPSRARQSVRKDDILFSTVRTYLKKIARIEQDYPNPVASTGFTALRAAEGVSPQFLFWQILSEDFLQPLHRLQSGSSFPAVRDKDVFAQPIRLAPSREQERIVAKLDTLLSRVAAGEAAARRALDRLQRYRAAVLHAAVTGELTSGWRKAHPPEETGAQLLERLLVERRARWEEAELKLLQAAGKSPKDDMWKQRYTQPAPFRASDRRDTPENWAWASIEQLNPGDRGCAYGVLQPGPDVPRGVLLVRVGDINEGRISTEGMKRIAPRIAARHERTKLEGGELLITLVGAIGRTAVVPESLAGANTARAIGVVPLNPLINADWVELWFRSPSTRNETVGKAHEVARKTLNLEDVRVAAVPVPPMDEQEEIVRDVQRRLTAADRLALSLSRQLERARVTRQSLLREAFAGKLVEQEPTDEPASLLLKLIGSAREAEAKKPKAKRMPKPKVISVETLEQLETLIQKLGKGATPERLLLAAGLGADVERFFDLLRDGRDKGSLFVPVGKGTVIRRN